MSATDRESKKSSEELFTRASELMPGGVNSPVRAFRGVGGDAALHRVCARRDDDRR